MESRQPTSVSIDGEAIRRIREEKRLTQLYVSKVVGVTTDTVSRWENNRYPTIRRDNALKLAEALEVELEEILKQEEQLEVDIKPSLDEPRKNTWPLMLFALVVFGGILFFSLRGNHGPQPVVLAERMLPPYAAPGSRVLIRLHIASDNPLKGMILREDFPKGWTFIESEPPASSVDNIDGVARWIFRAPKLPATLSYILQVGNGEPFGKELEFNGELIANPEGQRFVMPLVNLGRVRIAPLHWADTNGNQIIEDLEILEVSDLIDETGQLSIEWDLLEKIWDAGGYRWDAERRQFIPVRPQIETEAPAQALPPDSPPADQ